MIEEVSKYHKYFSCLEFLVATYFCLVLESHALLVNQVSQIMS